MCSLSTFNDFIDIDCLINMGVNQMARKAFFSFNYEIDESLKKGNGLLGIYIHKCPVFDGSTDTKGTNPFDNLYLDRNGTKQFLSEIYKTYDWIDNNGRENLGNWIENAAKDAGR